MKDKVKDVRIEHMLRVIARNADHAVRERKSEIAAAEHTPIRSIPANKLIKHWDQAAIKPLWRRVHARTMCACDHLRNEASLAGPVNSTPILSPLRHLVAAG
jgi:hypothetical protein